MTALTLKQYPFQNKVVFLRADLNVPLDEAGQVTDTTRLEAISETLQLLVEGGSKVILASHFGRPKGKVTPDYSLARVLPALQGVYPEIEFVFDPKLVPGKWGKAAETLTQGQVLLGENLRFYPGEEAGDAGFADDLARGVDLYVNDAFSCSHRAHASIVALAERVPAVMGEGFRQEISALERLLRTPKKPLTALIGGAKISTKLGLLQSLLEKVDQLVVVGAMANTLYAAMGLAVGRSLVELDMLDEATDFLKKARTHGCELHLPEDVLVTREIAPGAKTRVCLVSQVQPDDIIVDAGTKAVEALQDVLKDSGTVVWNGALGIAEIDAFSHGTASVARCLGALTEAGQVVSVAGGGDTLALIKKAGVGEEDFSYLSTAGGAFLEWLEGKTLPGLKALEIER